MDFLTSTRGREVQRASREKGRERKKTKPETLRLKGRHTERKDRGTQQRGEDDTHRKRERV